MDHSVVSNFTRRWWVGPRGSAKPKPIYNCAHLSSRSTGTCISIFSVTSEQALMPQLETLTTRDMLGVRADPLLRVIRL